MPIHSPRRRKVFPEKLLQITVQTYTHELDGKHVVVGSSDFSRDGLMTLKTSLIGSNIPALAVEICTKTLMILDIKRMQMLPKRVKVSWLLGRGRTQIRS